MEALMPDVDDKKQDALVKLAVLRSKLQQLDDSLTAFLDMPMAAQWTEILAQFNSLISKFQTVTNELQAPYVRQLLLYPSKISPQDPEFVPRVFLRTKLIPEIENMEKALRSADDALAAKPDDNALRAALRRLEIKIDLHEELVKHAEETFENFDDYNFRLRPDDDPEAFGPTLVRSDVDDKMARKVLADAFPVLQLRRSDNAPAICCTRNITGSLEPPHFITCRNNRIVAIHFYMLSLNSFIPPTIGNLDALEYLYLDDCGLTGNIPSWLGSLSGLTQLSLWGNSLNSTIPPALGNLRSLTYLVIDKNILWGSATVLTRGISVSMKAPSDCDSFYARLGQSVPSSSVTSPLSTRGASSTSGSRTGVTAPATSTLVTTESPSPSKSSGPPVAAIAGGVVGGLLLVTAAIIALIFVKKRRAANPPNQPKDLKVDGTHPAAPPQPPTANFDAPPAFENAYLPSVPASAPLAPPPEKSPHALFSELRYPQRPGQLPLRVDQAPQPSRKKEMDAVVSEKPIIEMNASVSGKPMVLVAPARGQSLGGANIAQQRGGSSMVVSREREPLSLLASLSSAEVGERLLRIGVGPGLVSALEENNVNGANMLALTDADLLAMGINEVYSREIVLRGVASIVEGERERIERAAIASMRGEGLPQYSQ
ncbi:hypothetical protein HDU96_008361 [Phlyctochytrium bullatum]|nr:hypothetical protein HDU96_008361 [Phlyctochytrium bullatum]